VAPEKKDISTGAIVAGALGLAALVGVVAVAATSKKGAHHGGGRHHKPTHRKPSKHAKKRRK
jgi:hypothetical protein